MELKLVKNRFFDLPKRNRKWVLLFAAFGFSSYGLYRVYHSPSMAKKRIRLMKLFGAFISLAEAISESAESVSIVSKDLKHFIQSDTDKIPNSFTQISKIANSKEFAHSVVNLTQALTMGIMQGYNKFEGKRKDGVELDSSFSEKVMDKLFTTAGSGFASVVVGSFARNLVMGFYSNSSNSNSVDEWVDVACWEKCRELVGDCIQLFVGTMVTVFLDKTMHINTYDQFFAGLTNPNHDDRVKDVLVSLCNGAVETAVKTSHSVLTNSSSDSKLTSRFDHDQEQADKSCDEFDEKEQQQPLTEFGKSKSVWSALSVPGNQRFVLDLTGKVTFETVRSLLEFVLEKLYDAIRRCTDVVHEAVVERSNLVVQYATEKSLVIATVCLSLCLHILDSAWILSPV